MQSLLQISQEEAKVSRILAAKAHKLSESMKKDSLSMRTVMTIAEDPHSSPPAKETRTDFVSKR